MDKGALEGDPFSVATHALSCGAAVCTGVDSFIPLVLRNGRISFVYVHVETGSFVGDYFYDY